MGLGRRVDAKQSYGSIWSLQQVTHPARVIPTFGTAACCILDFNWHSHHVLWC